MNYQKKFTLILYIYTLIVKIDYKRYSLLEYLLLQ